MGFISSLKQKAKSTSIIASKEKKLTEEKIRRFRAEQKVKHLEEEKRRQEGDKPNISRAQQAINISNQIAKGFDTAGRIASRTPIMQPTRAVKAYSQDYNDISGYLQNFMPDQPKRKVKYVDDGLDWEHFLRGFQP